ncbi:MAG: hypothetical protein M3162_05515 [Thermoproteota archaeon]|nr:hypothetical protein [Thermoproteota archaeon]
MGQCYGFGNSLKQLFQGEFTLQCNKILPGYAFILLLAIISLMYLTSINETFAQAKPKNEDNQLFKVIVKVTNNAKVNHLGAIHVAIDGTNQSKVVNNAQFPANKTVTHNFEFNAMYIPIGKGFTAEVVYGDDVFKRTYGVNTPANTPEIAKITIP